MLRNETETPLSIDAVFQNANNTLAYAPAHGKNTLFFANRRYLLKFCADVENGKATLNVKL
jgi:hypothetical protein